jgi:hypothetical protein
MESIFKKSVNCSSGLGDPAKVPSSLELLTVPGEAGKMQLAGGNNPPTDSGESCKFSGETPELLLLQIRPEISGRPEKFIEDSTKPGGSHAAFDGEGKIVDAICIWKLVFPNEPGGQSLLS